MGINAMGHLFSPGLLWDIDPAQLDLRENAAWLIARVLNYGDMADWRQMLELYSLAEIKAAAQTRRDITPKSRNFALLVIADMEADAHVR